MSWCPTHNSEFKGMPFVEGVPLAWHDEAVMTIDEQSNTNQKTSSLGPAHAAAGLAGAT